MIGIKLMLIMWILLLTTGCSKPQTPPKVNNTYHFNFTDGQNHRTESKDKDGTVQGSYTYIGQDGIKRITQYSVGPQGHQVAGIHQLPLQNPILVAFRRTEPPLPPPPQQTPIPRSSGLSPHYIPSVEELIKFTYQNNDLIQPQQIPSSPDANHRTELL